MPQQNEYEAPARPPSPPASGLEMQAKSLARKEAREGAAEAAARRLISSRSTLEGWCLVACGGTGVSK